MRLASRVFTSAVMSVPKPATASHPAQSQDNKREEKYGLNAAATPASAVVPAHVSPFAAAAAAASASAASSPLSASTPKTATNFPTRTPSSSSSSSTAASSSPVRPSSSSASTPTKALAAASPATLPTSTTANHDTLKRKPVTAEPPVPAPPNVKRTRAEAEMENDEVTVRRLERNRVAAKRSRERRKDYVHNLENTSQSLYSENLELRDEIEKLRLEVSVLRQNLDNGPMDASPAYSSSSSSASPPSSMLSPPSVDFNEHQIQSSNNDNVHNAAVAMMPIVEAGSPQVMSTSVTPSPFGVMPSLSAATSPSPMPMEDELFKEFQRQMLSL